MKHKETLKAWINYAETKFVIINYSIVKNESFKKSLMINLIIFRKINFFLA